MLPWVQQNCFLISSNSQWYCITLSINWAKYPGVYILIKISCQIGDVFTVWAWLLVEVRLLMVQSVWLMGTLFTHWWSHPVLLLLIPSHSQCYWCPFLVAMYLSPVGNRLAINWVNNIMMCVRQYYWLCTLSCDDSHVDTLTLAHVSQ